MFSVVADKLIQNLIIDIRDCKGGKSYLSKKLLKKISKVPFKQMSKTFFNKSRALKKIIRPNLSLLLRPFFNVIINNENDCYYYNSGLSNPDCIYDGDIYVLTSNYTFSSALGFSNAIKEYKIGVIIGEETGGNTSSYGPSIPIKLTNSNIRVLLSIMKNISPSGIDNNRGVIPDYPVKQTINDFIQEIDTALEFTLKQISK